MDAMTIGSAVRTADGTTLGSVKEIRRESFKVDARLRPDYWLLLTEVNGVTAGNVTLGFVLVDLPYHELEEVV